MIVKPATRSSAKNYYTKLRLLRAYRAIFCSLHVGWGIRATSTVTGLAFLERRI